MPEDLFTFFSPGKFNFDILDFPLFIYLSFEILNCSLSFVDTGMLLLLLLLLSRFSRV